MADILNFFNIKTAEYYNILTIFLRKRGWIVLYNMHQNRISSFQWCELCYSDSHWFMDRLAESPYGERGNQYWPAACLYFKYGLDVP